MKNNSFFLNKGAVKALKERYKNGMRVELISMDDPYSKLVPGDQGTIDFVDDIGTVHVKWDKGSCLGLIPNVDEFKII